MQSFLKQISGVELPIVASPSGPAIFIGQSPETASALGIPDWKRLKPDEIRLKSAGGNLYLAGDRPRGTLYAVYELLEKEFGVRFWTADATHVPKREKLELPQIDLRYAPPFEVRAAGYDLIRHDPRFSARTRNNGHGVVDSVEWGASEQLLGGVTHSVKTCRCSPGTRILRPIRNGFPNGTGSGFRASFAWSNPEAKGADAALSSNGCGITRRHVIFRSLRMTITISAGARRAKRSSSRTAASQTC